MSGWLRLRSLKLVGLGLCLPILIAACGQATTTSHARAGGVVTFAEQPNSPPNYILPMASGSYFSVVNLYTFSQNMYVPLYWFGNHGQPTLNRALSVANPPLFSDHNSVVTIDLKHWQWSDGAPITARDVVFWINLLSAVTDPAAPTVGSNSAPGPGWGAAIPGAFPENVVSYNATGTYTVQMKLNGSYNPTWFTYNELRQIYPIPQAAWDRLSSGGPVGDYDASAETRVLAPSSDHLPANSYVPANPGTASSGALGVAQFLNSQSQDLGTYTSNPLWKVVDGPFKLSQFTTSGFVKFVPNRGYSGSPKASISAFELEPFTTDTAEFDALHNGSLTIGYIPVQDLGQRANLEKTEGYSYSPWFDFGIVYFPYNFTNPTVGPIFRQLYFREAFQSLVNQKQYIKDFLGGIGTVGNGPVPEFPPHNPFESPLEAGGQVYPYDPARATALLASHGWKVKPGGTTVCGKPGSGAGDCGIGISAGQPLTFTLLYASGSTSLTNQMEAMQSTMKAEAGISLSLKTAPFAQVIGTAFNGCSYAKPCSGWQLADWGGGWVYGFDPLPTGGELFSTGASSNPGDYSNPVNDQNITATHTAPSYSAEIKDLFKYEDYLAQQLPVVWMPGQPTQLTMYKSDLRGVTPQDVYDKIYPQYYSFGAQ